MASISFRGNNHGLQIGDNRGSINAEFHLPPERPETPPSPLSTVPFPRDPHFVARDTLLHKIHEKASVPGGRVENSASGSRRCRVRSKSPATWVFWVHASNEARFEESFRDIADQVKIPGRQDPKTDIFKLVEKWLRNEKIRKWVCILDNVDDDQLLGPVPVVGKGDPMRSLTNASTKPLLEYVPRSQNGSIIITSRNRKVALKIVHHHDLIEVKPMEGSEALELLRRKLEQPCDGQESQQLVNALEFMPLAIVQAASYIQIRAPRYSVSHYLRDFQKSDREATKLLEEEAGYLYRDWEAKNSILVTWQLSFDYIRQTKPSAAKLLSFMSFFDREGIPENLILRQPQVNEISSPELPNEFSDRETSEFELGADFEDNVAILSNYSFISVKENSTSFTMHRLVQLTTRAWLKSHGQIDHWRDKFISTLCEEFPTGEYENWERCRPLFSHVKSAMSQRPNSLESLEQWATLLFKGACTNMVATAYWLEGRWEESEQLEVQVMETRKTKLGEDHPSTLSSIDNLASTYWKQGRWEEAEQLQVHVIEMSKVTLGEDHPDTLTSMANLTATYWSQGRWEEAEQLEVQVLHTRKKTLGEDHPDTLRSIGNLALTYTKQGQWIEAEKVQVQVMEYRKRKLGEDHPSTLSSMSKLALTYRGQGQWEEAEKLQVQVMETSKMKLGEDHPDTLMSMNNLALTYRDQGQLGEAEKLQVQAMETSKAKLGEDHPHTISRIANLASTYVEQGRWEEAEQLQVQALHTRKTKLGGRGGLAPVQTLKDHLFLSLED
ncbi:hypothetical protein N7481_009086 [Penicillium waksmanii]|uniref:uncharacterized protein n=1 Tax=Penicillium waksmanii TaxID=69791 RepID=UPI002548642C|nr:uncharacterized protein N7481_009086 [Penicillium waksmanii]KAJ5975379.1 hypothetical protein N7481_009086 [Penicillium waksmanii]